MADVKISALTDATSVADADELVVVQGGSTKRATRAEVLTPTVVTSSGTGSYTVDWSAGSVYDRTLTGNATLTLSNPATGVPYTLFLRQNATGGYTVTFSTTVKWMGQDPIWSGVASKISGVVTLMFVASAWVGWWGGGEQ